MSSRLRPFRVLLLTLLLPLALLGGCASTNPRDPFEPVNRAVYTFNDAVDTAVIRPLAEAYRAVLPSFVRTGISNFFSNINDILVALNNLLQGKVVAAASDVGRVAVNTSLGLAGLFDVATRMGLEKHNEDFGQTLGYWGVGDGPYLVLPFLGPSSLRDTIGRAVDSKGDPLGFLRDIPWRNSLWGTRAVNQRAELLDTSKILETAALDPYEFLRDGYLQRRRNLIYDGSPPREKDEDAKLKDSRVQARAESPFPSSGEAEGLFPGTPLPSGAEFVTSARAQAPQTVPAAADSPAPRKATPQLPQADALPLVQPALTIEFQVRQPVPSIARASLPAAE